jgi:hypothetical protein
MKTFTVVPASYLAHYHIDADRFGDLSSEQATLLDAAGKVVAVISMRNVAAVYQEGTEPS